MKLWLLKKFLYKFQKPRFIQESPLINHVRINNWWDFFFALGLIKVWSSPFGGGNGILRNLCNVNKDHP